MLLRLIDYLKSRQITALFTALDSGDIHNAEQAGVSSLMDAWLLVQTIEGSGERNRGLYVIKARGIAHSNQIREFLLTNEGIRLRDVYVGQGAVFTGAARVAQEARESEIEVERQLALAVKKREIEVNRRKIEAQIAVLQAELEGQTNEAEVFVTRQSAATYAAAMARRNLAKSRGSKA